MNTQPHTTAPTLFPNPPSPGYVLWYRPDSRRTAWEPVATTTTEQQAVNAIGIGGRRHGRWLIPPNGTEP